MTETITPKRKAAMNVTSFRGYRYNPQIVSDPAACIAPPYDVIDDDHRDGLHRQSPYNIAHITKPAPLPPDSSDKLYARSAQLLKQYIAAGALRRDDRESIYIYVQEFTVAGQTYCRTGFIALGELDDNGGIVLPHEHTLAAPKADRLNLMRAIHSQIGQIFVLYDDPIKTIDALLDQAAAGDQLLSHRDDQEVTHRLFALTDPAHIETIKDVMKHQTVFIADGHHRYETALNYYRETNNPAAAFCMMTFVNTHNEGLIILPTHRFIKNIADFSVPRLIGSLQAWFDVARLEFHDAVEKTQKREMMFEALKFEFENREHAFGMYFNDGAFYVATLRDPAALDALAPDMSQPWRQLDVAILHKLVLEKILGIDEQALSDQTNVEYIKDFGPATLQALDRVDEGRGQGLFFLNPTRPEEVEAVALAGERMPQKSTFFHPKIFSGLVLHVLE